MRSRIALPRSRGFTLIELVAVVAIITILAALVLAIAGPIQDSAIHKLTGNQIQTVTTLLETYKADNGTYPLQVNGAADTSTEVVIAALLPLDPGAKQYPLPLKLLDSYRPDISAAEIRRNATHLVDPYGNPYHYQFTGASDRNGKSAFDLWSKGKQNSSNERLWVTNW